ncbi:MAG: BlaI/MecI/CopY family transcriptional regulator [Planctomycetota bacterium]
MDPRPEISNSEWQVMNVIWDHQPTTASEVIKQLSEKNRWSPATIRTFLHRLIKKGALRYEQDGNRYLYRAAVTRSATIKKASRSFSSSVFDGQIGPLLTHFVKTNKLTEEEIQELQALLETKERKR